MPAGLVLHVADALALGGFHHNGGGRSLGLPRLMERGLDLVKVVTVDLHHVPAKGFQLVRNGVGAHDLVHRAVDLESVVVNDGAQVVQLIVVGQHEGLPHLALLNFAVAQ